ncbi:L,D-transpeptidase [Streptomyces phaeochromogenes]|uniref:Ig-like domain-containing protein n=1 Tax=Streptomyces phaeochromogenes TaxID=1923 RepID=A0ABZ1HI97_STRPH|nr:Ig-like domain-containing protein [Streptomyces phaeochromogenes]WRZ32856.1 Ig-like domain-containing protein [Streptomyces phaeochromogenes]WSD18342.1 Ig-like domain-containing protein [Streptomyces phaeochromogenes]WSJ04847.1 Ig-like domain-containing protein [Streptomyces phaeochromogenes]
MSHTPRYRTAVSTALIVALGAGVTACGSDGHPLSAKPYDAAEDISFSIPVDDGKKADPDKPLEITAEDSDDRITDVTATDAAGRYVAGELSADGTRWHSTSPLAAGVHYRVRVSTEDEDGAPGRKVVDFDTGTPTTKRLDVKFGPDKGTYGVGQPVTAELSLPVKDKAARAVVERSLKVDSRPAVEGAWHWVDDKKLHYRPKEYWPAQATVSARSNLAGIKVAERLWGGKAKPLTLTTGDRVEAVTDASAHSMTVYRNGEAIKSIPVTTGKPGYDTRNGVKVVLGKEGTVRMTSASIGSSDFYDLIVHNSVRLTNSGEYVHAAPWSTGSQGYANVSHGCTGMSSANAQWFYENIRAGDIVQVVNSSGDMMAPFGNGFGDWNLTWKKWRTGSALVADTPEGPGPEARLRLRPESV